MGGDFNVGFNPNKYLTDDVVNTLNEKYDRLTNNEVDFPFGGATVNYSVGDAKYSFNGDTVTITGVDTNGDGKVNADDAAIVTDLISRQGREHRGIQSLDNAPGDTIFYLNEDEINATDSDVIAIGKNLTMNVSADEPHQAVLMTADGEKGETIFNELNVTGPAIFAMGDNIDNPSINPGLAIDPGLANKAGETLLTLNADGAMGSVEADNQTFYVDNESLGFISGTFVDVEIENGARVEVDAPVVQSKVDGYSDKPTTLTTNASQLNSFEAKGPNASIRPITETGTNRGIVEDVKVVDMIAPEGQNHLDIQDQGEGVTQAFVLGFGNTATGKDAEKLVVVNTSDGAGWQDIQKDLMLNIGNLNDFYSFDANKLPEDREAEYPMDPNGEYWYDVGVLDVVDKTEDERDILGVVGYYNPYN